MYEENWSKSEKAVARRAFKQAYQRECSALSGEVRRRAISIKEPSDLWALEDLLSRERRATDEKYVFRYSRLIFVFAQLIREGWLSKEELAGLAEEKIAKIRTLSKL